MYMWGCFLCGGVRVVGGVWGGVCVCVCVFFFFFLKLFEGRTLPNTVTINRKPWI